MRLAICYPSRGTGHDRTLAGVIREVADASVEPVWCWAFGLPLPDAANECVRQALAADADALWFVENDHLLPVGVLRALLACDAPVVAADYLLRSGRPCAICNEASGEWELVGLGCTLIQRAVLRQVPDPPFQVGNRWQWDGGRWVDTGMPEHAGGHDVFFCRAVRAAGLRIAVLDGWQAGHLETVRRGDHVNIGMDEIRCHGGTGELPWYPQRRETMAVRYFKSPSGLVLDIDAEQGGEPDFYLGKGWVEIKAAEFKPLAKAQADAQAKKREEWLAEMEQHEG